MVRMSKAKQDKLESIMHLVEQLGIDRVLGRLRQTKMMSKDVLDDMKEWETDYEKRVALLGFLVSPEGKRAFGALYELSKVHEEQLKLQEEQEKLRQEQLAQKSQNADLRKYGGRGKGGAANANMKLKLRAQLAKRREPQPPSSAAKPDSQATPPQPQAQQIVIPAPTASKSGKRGPMVATPSTTTVENGEVTTTPRTEEPVSKVKDKPQKDRKSPSPIQGGVRRSTDNTQLPSQDLGLDLSLTGSAAIQIPQSTTKTITVTHQPPVGAEQSEAPKSPEIVEVKPEEPTTDGQWGRESSVEAEGSEEETGQEMPIESDRPPPDGENAEDEKDKHDTHDKSVAPVKKVRINSSVKVIEVRDSAPNSPSTTSSTPVIHRRKLHDIHQKLLNGEISVDKLTMDQIKEIVAEWQIMKRDNGDDGEYILKELQHAKDDLKKMTDEKDRIRKEKDRYVFKEFELQQKLQDLQSKHKSLRDDHESLKQGNYQIQQNTKKNNKIHQDMRKKIAKLESKIKSMDKVTLRKGTQTTEVFDKDVHEALRIAEESLQVTQAELKDAMTKSKAAQQEAEDLKKLLNAKGREINKRERKSKKDEETIRFITRERDAMETKLRKVTEQLEYYKGMMEIRTKGGKRQVPEKKEVRVQRCSSGRHVLLKTHVAAGCHQGQEETKHSARNDSEDPKNTSNKRNSLTNGNASKQTKQATSTTKTSNQTQNTKQNEQSGNKATTKTTNSTVNSSTATKSSTNTTNKTSSSNNASLSSSKTTTVNKAGNANVSSSSTTTKGSLNASAGQKSSNSSDPKSQTSKTAQSKDNTDSSRSDKSPPKPVGTESPKLANKRPAPTKQSDPKATVGSSSPGPIKRAPAKPDEKLVRPKAATVRQTAPVTNTQKK